MRKLRLELDSLDVQTFETHAGKVQTTGTIDAHESEDPPNTDPHLNTCDVLSCGGTCWLTPNACGSCGCGETNFDPCG
ncbi:MAG TPA: hypothetical protein VHG08_20815 [Longimicrobium sp.]|nr:hypothetical protein [Longimicrobium sp.]